MNMYTAMEPDNAWPGLTTLDRKRDLGELRALLGRLVKSIRRGLGK